MTVEFSHKLSNVISLAATYKMEICSNTRRGEKKTKEKLSQASSKKEM